MHRRRIERTSVDRDIRTYLGWIGLSAVLITAAGLALLVFGGSGLTEEMKRARRDEQHVRYVNNLKNRMANRRRAYASGGPADFVWRLGEAPAEVDERTRYGCFVGKDGGTIGWARMDDGTVIGYREKGFKYVDRWKMYLFGVGAALVVGLFCTLCACGWRLAWAARRAREDAEEKETFLDMVSHELNTPLGSIVPLSAALADGGIREERKAEALELVRRESERMARMIGELLTVARLRKGSIPFQKATFNLAEVAAAAAAVIRGRYPDCAVMVDGDACVPAFADRDKTEQIILNLLENACRYAPSAPISVLCHAPATLEVSDRGPGIPAQDLDRFRPSSHGLGLGLSIVSAFARGMGGSVSVHSRQGGGTTFRVSLPPPKESGHA